MHLNYIDIYFCFMLIFLLFFITIFNKTYLLYKHEEGIISKSNQINLFINCFIFMFLFKIIYIFDLNWFEFYFNTLNLLIIYKLFLFVFSIFYLFIIKNFAFMYKSFSFEFIWILMFSIFCLSLLIEVDNLLYFYVILEAYSLSILSCLVLKKLSKKFLNASFNYLIINIITSCLILYSVSLIYFCAGLLNFNELNDILNGANNINYKTFLVYNIFL